MALRGVVEHPKFAQLKAILGTGKGETLGYLEAVWHFTGRFAMQGNIGKFSDAEIESWIEWKGKPGKLIEALTQARWIDRSRAHRLIIHDWQDHADQTTRKMLGARKLPFLSGSIPEGDDNPPSKKGKPSQIDGSLPEVFRNSDGNVPEQVENTSGPPEPGAGPGPVPVPGAVPGAEPSNARANRPGGRETPTTIPNSNSTANPTPPAEKLFAVERTAAGFAKPVAPKARDKPAEPSAEELTQVREILREYMQGDTGQPVDAPDDGIVRKVIESAHGASPALVKKHLWELFHKGHAPRYAAGPKSYAWFPTVVENYFGAIARKS